MATNMNHTLFIEAKKRYELEPNDTHYRSLFNALVPYLKNAAAQQQNDHFRRTIAEMHKYQFLSQPFSANQTVWCFITLFSAESKQNKLNADDFKTLLSYLKLLNNHRPSPEHSLLLRFYLKNTHLHEYIQEMMDWWDIQNFRPEDYLPEPYKNITYPPLAESYFTAHAKQLLLMAAQHKSNEVNKELLALTDQLNLVVLQHPSFKFLPYYVVKLKLATGANRHEMYDELLPFVRQNISHFWAWELLADLAVDNPEKQMAFLSQAMICPGDNKMKINLMTKLVNAFLASGFRNEAKSLVNRIIIIRQENRWKIPNNIDQMTRDDWYLKASNEQGFLDVVKTHALKAADFLCDGMEMIQGVINYVSEDGKIAGFATTDNQRGQFRLTHFLPKKSRPGMLIDLQIEPAGLSDYQMRVVFAKPSANQHNNLLKKEMRGKMKINSARNFAMINNAFIPGNLVNFAEFNMNQHIEATVVKSFDQKKSQWGWKAVMVKKI